MFALKICPPEQAYLFHVLYFDSSLSLPPFTFAKLNLILILCSKAITVIQIFFTSYNPASPSKYLTAYLLQSNFLQLFFSIIEISRQIIRFFFQLLHFIS